MGNGDQTVWASIDGLREDIKELIKNGCAKREGDINRVELIEKIIDSHGKKLDKIFYTSLVTAGGIIAFLLKAVLPVIFGGK
jgi:hypothetical protein